MIGYKRGLNSVAIVVYWVMAFVTSISIYIMSSITFFLDRDTILRYRLERNYIPWNGKIRIEKKFSIIHQLSDHSHLCTQRYIRKLLSNFTSVCLSRSNKIDNGWRLMNASIFSTYALMFLFQYSNITY